MSNLSPRALKSQAKEILKNTRPKYSTLVLQHSALTVGAVLVVTVINLILNHFMDQASGLSGLGTQGILQTIRLVLSVGVNVLTPFWSIGIVYTSILVSRKQSVRFSLLKQGFVRFGPVLRSFLLLGIVMTVLSFVLSNALTVCACFFPIPESVQNRIVEMNPQSVEDTYAVIASMDQGELMQIMLPMLVVQLLGAAVLSLYLNCRLWPMRYLLMDGEKKGAFQVFLQSNQLTRGHKWKLLWLDVSFWWYYAIQAALYAVSMLPAVLHYAGFSLPVSQQVLDFGCFALYAAGTLALVWAADAYVQTTFACAYNSLLQANIPKEETENV